MTQASTFEAAAVTAEVWSGTRLSFARSAASNRAPDGPTRSIAADASNSSHSCWSRGSTQSDPGAWPLGTTVTMMSPATRTAATIVASTLSTPTAAPNAIGPSGFVSSVHAARFHASSGMVRSVAPVRRFP